MRLTVLYSEYCDVDIPPPFTARVRNALNAEPRAVRLSSLVGVGNHWYAHGMNLVQLCVCLSVPHALDRPSNTRTV